MSIKDQGHSLNKVKFHVELSWDKGIKIYANGSGHMTNMAPMPIYGKNRKYLLLLSQKADDLESLYAALGIRVLPTKFVQILTLG